MNSTHFHRSNSRFSRQSGNRAGRPHHGGRPQHSQHRGGQQRKPRPVPDIAASKFINKAVITEEAEVFAPEHAFADFAVDVRIKSNVAQKGYVTPTPIQDRSIPHILHGKDVVGIANTGTGKTGAFLIPLIDKVIKDPRQNVLVMVPTRELATQIDDEFKGFARGLNIRSVVCVGGVNINPQLNALRQHSNFVIATPGRLKDLIDRKAINLGTFRTLVLDEADRMLDMGFIHDIRALVSKMPRERHTLFFSATLSPDIERLIGDFLREPIRISVKTRDTSKNVDQDIVRIPQGASKVDMLVDLLSQEGFDRVLVFGRTKHGVRKLAKMLEARGIPADSIHGNKTQPQRDRALKAFKDGKVRVLVATDVAARGLDISGVSHVINFDVPATYDDYVHRIGRTGRAGATGKALTFVDHDHR